MIEATICISLLCTNTRFWAHLQLYETRSCGVSVPRSSSARDGDRGWIVTRANRIYYIVPENKKKKHITAGISRCWSAFVTPQSSSILKLLFFSDKHLNVQDIFQGLRVEVSNLKAAYYSRLLKRWRLLPPLPPKKHLSAIMPQKPANPQKTESRPVQILAWGWPCLVM